MNEIALVANQGPKLETMADVWTIAQMYHRAGMIPNGVKSPAQLMIILTAGAELGFGPTWALKNVASFNGQAMVHSDGPVSLVLRSGLMEWQQSGFEGKSNTDDYRAWFEVKRKGIEHPVRREFSVGDAKAAGLWGKSIWKNYPTRMLMMRARAYALRDLFADVLGGIGILEEHLGHEQLVASVEDVTTGSRGLLNALTGPQEAPGDVVESEWVESAPEVVGVAPEPVAEPEPVPESKAKSRGRKKAVITDDDPPVDIDALSDEPSPEEIEEIRQRELAEAAEQGLFGGAE